MTSDLLLEQLQRTFPAGSTTGTFDAGAVDDGAFAATLAAVGIPSTLSLRSPDGWRQSGDVITLAGTSLTPILGIDEPAVYIQFTPAGDDFTMLLDVALPPTWTFGQSFRLLRTDLFTALRLDPARPSALVVASGPASDPLRLDGGAPLAVTETLTFFGWFDTNSTGWSQIAWVAAGGQGSAVTGAITVDDPVRGAVSMRLPLARGRVGPLAGSSGLVLSLEMALHSGVDAALAQYVSGVRFDTTADFATVAGDETLELSALVTNTVEGIVDLTASGTALAFPSPRTLAQWFGAGNGIGESLPPGVDASIARVNALTVGVGRHTRRVEYAFLSVGILPGYRWAVWPGVLELGDISLLFAAFDPLGSPRYSFDLSARVLFGGLPLVVRASLPAVVVSGSLDAPYVEDGDYEDPSVAGFLQSLFGTTAGVPETLRITTLDFSADLDQLAYSAELEIEGEWSFAFGEQGVVTFEELRLTLSGDDTGAEGTITAVFRVGGNAFTVFFDVAPGNTLFRGTWEAGEVPLTYQDLAIALGMYGLPAFPEGLALSFTRADFQFESAGPSFSFDIETAEYGAAAFLGGRDAAGNWGFVFGMEAVLGLSLDLTEIPVVGDLVPAGADVVALEALRIVGASSTLPLYTPTPELARIFGETVNSGLALSVGIRLGDAWRDSLSVRFGGADDQTRYDVPPPPLELPEGVSPPPPVSFRVSPPGVPTTAAPGPQYNWVEVQRAFGPVQFGRIGFAITPDDRLALAVDGSVSLAGLTIALTGLGAEMPISAPYLPTFDLAGLAVEYAAAGVEVGGALVKVPGAASPTYTGDLVVEVGRFGALAMGSYSSVNGSPSLFAFLLLDVPLGGPGFFFVTGVAGGFGFNRTLELPTIDTVATYPLVQGAMGTLDARSTVAALDRYIRPAANQDWFAAGIRFTSYGMLRSYVLATLSFGATVEVGLMGESTLALPPVGEGEAIAPIARADLVLLVDLVPSSGTLAVAAQLSPASYVLSRQARLTGGFAFHLWFPPSPHAGDFVVALGGYNPYFEAPAHYPAVPRLGFSWTLSTELSIEGGLYCALTPSVVMAGGSLRATWKGGGLTAWLTADADFLMRLRPFSYAADVAVAVGVSYELDLWVTKKTVTVQVAGALTMWGQPFGGRAWVDASVLSFSFDFGAPRPPAAAELDWAAFRDAFLPPAQSSVPAPAAADAARAVPPREGGEVTATDSLVAIHAPAGLLGTYASGGDVVWRVDPAALRIVVATQVPSKTLAVSPPPQPALPEGWNTAFGVGPMGAAPAEVAVALSVSLTRDGAPDGDGWSAGAVTGNVPTGVWLSTTADMSAEPVVRGVLTGVELVPRVPAPDATLPVPVERLLGDAAPVVAFAWETAAAPTTDPFDQDDAMAAMQRTLTDPAVAAARAAILTSLRRQGLRTAASVEVSRFAARAPDLLTAAPQLRLLGETPTA